MPRKPPDPRHWMPNHYCLKCKKHYWHHDDEPCFEGQELASAPTPMQIAMPLLDDESLELIG